MASSSKRIGFFATTKKKGEDCVLIPDNETSNYKPHLNRSRVAEINGRLNNDGTTTFSPPCHYQIEDQGGSYSVAQLDEYLKRNNKLSKETIQIIGRTNAIFSLLDVTFNDIVRRKVRISETQPLHPKQGDVWMIPDARGGVVIRRQRGQPSKDDPLNGRSGIAIWRQNNIIYVEKERNETDSLLHWKSHMTNAVLIAKERLITRGCGPTDIPMNGIIETGAMSYYGVHQRIFSSFDLFVSKEIDIMDGDDHLELKVVANLDRSAITNALYGLIVRSFLGGTTKLVIGMSETTAPGEQSLNKILFWDDVRRLDMENVYEETALRVEQQLGWLVKNWKHLLSRSTQNYTSMAAVKHPFPASPFRIVYNSIRIGLHTDSGVRWTKAKKGWFMEEKDSLAVFVVRDLAELEDMVISYRAGKKRTVRAQFYIITISGTDETAVRRTIGDNFGVSPDDVHVRTCDPMDDDSIKARLPAAVQKRLIIAGPPLTDHTLYLINEGTVLPYHLGIVPADIQPHSFTHNPGNVLNRIVAEPKKIVIVGSQNDVTRTKKKLKENKNEIPVEEIIIDN